MKDSKLARQLAAMDSRERQRFRYFVDSPYHNQHQPSRDLLKLLLEGLEQGNSALDRKRLYTKLFGRSATYHEQRLADLMSGLMKLLARFWAIEQLEEEPLLTEVLALQRTESAGRFDYFKSREKRLRRHIDNSTQRDRRLLGADYQRQVLYGYYRTTHENRGDEQAMQAILDKLEAYYLAEKLRHACHLTANTLLLNTNYDFGLLDQMLERLNSAEGQALYSDEPSIQCYYAILMSMRDSDDLSHYERLRHFLNQELHRFSPSEQEDLYLFTNNYCILRIRKGDSRFPRELFELMRTGVETGLLYRKGRISEWNYKNAVTLGSKLGEYEWTEAFMESHYDRLSPDKRENAYALNKAQYLYSRGRYEEAGELLARVTDSDVKYHLARVLLEVRIAYDQRETMYLLNQLETFRLYVLRQKKISADDRRSYTNYSRFAKQLANLRHQSDFIDKETLNRKLGQLHQKIAETRLLVGREWLLQESAVS